MQEPLQELDSEEEDPTEATWAVILRPRLFAVWRGL